MSTFRFQEKFHLDHVVRCDDGTNGLTDNDCKTSHPQFHYQIQWLIVNTKKVLVKYMKQMYVCGYIHVYGNNNVGKQNREADIIRASAESQCCQLNKKQNENQQENNTQRYVVLSR